jgi:hypothetical protein
LADSASLYHRDKISELTEFHPATTAMGDGKKLSQNSLYA